MDTYKSLHNKLSKNDISDINKALAPVTVGQEFMNKVKGVHYRKCKVTKLLPNSFEYEYIDDDLDNPRVKAMMIGYKFWSEYSYLRGNTYYIQAH